jgi:ARG/rhodanese/phosphatase superfamily protein
MRKSVVLPLAIMVASLSASASFAPASTADRYRITGPFTDGRLAAYFVRGISVAKPVSETLQEGLDNKQVRVELDQGQAGFTVENLSDREVFLQSGETLAVGNTLRVIADSELLPPHSPRIGIRAFCLDADPYKIEMSETCLSTNVKYFREYFRHSGASYSRGLRFVARGAVTRAFGPLQLVFPGQDPLYHSKGDPDEMVLEGRLSRLSRGEGDILGYAFAINGTICLADIYASHELFLKMWPELFRYSVGEASYAKRLAAVAPSAGNIDQFISSAETGKVSERSLGADNIEETRESDIAWRLETRRADGSWILRTYIGKTCSDLASSMWTKSMAPLGDRR